LQSIVEELKKIVALYSGNSIQEAVGLSATHLNTIKNRYAQLGREQQLLCADMLEEMFLSEEDNIILRIFYLSYLLSVTGRGNYLLDLLSLGTGTQLTVAQKYDLYLQLLPILFIKHDLVSKDVKVGMHNLYRQIYMEYEQRIITADCRWIPLKERNRDFIIVMTNQFLGIGHGPSRMTMEYCCNLKEKFGKDVYIINTAETHRKPCSLLFFSPFEYTYKDLTEKEYEIQYRGLPFPFYQYSNTMPDEQNFADLMEFLNSRKPEMIINIGGPNITADLCSHIVPVATLPCSADFPATAGTFHILLRALTAEDEEYLIACGIDKERVIESRSTYCFQLPKIRCSRKELGIPETLVVLVVVGHRLDMEITEEYAEQLNELLQRNEQVFITFIGNFTKHTEFCARYPGFAARTNFLGFRSDLGAVYECCDAFLNPPRMGGGTSAAEALFMGLPVITFPFGDIAEVAGNRYHIQSLAEVDAFIARWSKEETFRLREKQAAQQRAAEITDMEGCLQKMLDDLYNSRLFQ
jgi:hypothetical protein